jgi:chromosome segregation ATPase
MRKPATTVLTRDICSDDLDDEDASIRIYHRFRMVITNKGTTYIINDMKVSAEVYRDALATLAAGPGQRA